jgi:hypothetical protein
MRDDRSPNVGRRGLLAAAAALTSTGLAGCAGDQTPGGVGNSFATDVIAHNAAPGPRTVSVTITATDAESPHTSRTLELSPNEVVDPVNSSKLPANSASYTVEVSVADGPNETFDWTDPAPELAPLWVLVDDSRNVGFLLEAG